MWPLPSGAGAGGLPGPAFGKAAAVGLLGQSLDPSALSEFGSSWVTFEIFPVLFGAALTGCIAIQCNGMQTTV